MPMNPLILARIFFVLLMTSSGYWLGRPNLVLEFTGLAFVFSLFIVALEHSTRILSTKKILLSAFGAFFGLCFGRLMASTIPTAMFPDPQMPMFIFNLLFMYFGIVMAIRNADRISLSRLRFFVGAASENTMLVDTSVIVDGRIVKMFETGFLTRTITVPAFIIDELQSLADSKDHAKRQYGRRGLDNLEELRSIDKDLQILEKDYEEVKGADHKLIALAKEMGAPLLSNDYNLCKVAGLHQVKALNINELSAALRLNLAVGDQVVLAIQREGKESHQGVGHLDDGTMVVVDNARNFIGQQVHAAVVNILHSNSGRMAFARLLDRPNPTSKDADSEPPAAPQAIPQSGGATGARVEVLRKGNG